MKKKSFFALICLLSTPNILAHGMSEADKAKALEASNWEYVELGAIHDHRLRSPLFYLV